MVLLVSTGEDRIFPSLALLEFSCLTLFLLGENVRLSDTSPE